MLILRPLAPLVWEEEVKVEGWTLDVAPFLAWSLYKISKPPTRFGRDKSSHKAIKNNAIQRVKYGFKNINFVFVGITRVPRNFYISQYNTAPVSSYLLSNFKLRISETEQRSYIVCFGISEGE